MSGDSSKKLLTLMVLIEVALVVVAIAVVLIGAPQMALALAVMSTVGLMLGYKLARWLD